MSCIRSGVTYKRHKMVKNTCTGCGAIKVPSEHAEEIRSQILKAMVEKMDAELTSLVSK